MTVSTLPAWQSASDRNDASDSGGSGIYNTSNDWGNTVSASAIEQDNAAYKLSPEAEAIATAAMPANIQTDMNNIVNQYGQVNQADAQAVAGWQNNQILAVNEIQNPESTLEKVMGGLALAGSVGALTAGVGAGVGAAVGGGLGGSLAGGAAAGATGAAATDVLTGQPLTLRSVGEGAGMGALGGGLAYGVGQYAGDLSNATGLPQGIVNQGLKTGSNALTNLVGSSLFGGGNPTGGLSPTANQAPGSGVTNGGSSMIGSSNTTVPYSSSLNMGSLGSLAGLFGAGFGQAGLNTVGNQATNAYTTAGNAANTMPWNVSGIGGMGATFANGQANITGGALNPLAAMYGSYGTSSLGGANRYANGSLPSGVMNAGNNAMSQFGIGQNNAATGFGQGQNMYSAGNNLVGSGQNTWNSAYNTSLNSAMAALQVPQQQQQNTLKNSQFEMGQSGTSGGALQSQAMYTGFGQADLQAQQNAVGQANSAMGIQLGYGTSLMNGGLYNSGQFNNQGMNAAQGGYGLQSNMATLSPQLAGMYGSNANQAVSGFGGINTMGLQNANFGLAAGTNQGNQMNNAARTQGSIAAAGTSGLPQQGYASLFNNLGGGGNSSALNSLSSLFGGFGGSASSYSPSLSNSDMSNIYSGSYSPNLDLSNSIPQYQSYGYDGGFS